MTITERVHGFLRLARPLNVVFASILTFVGAFVAGGVIEAVRPTGAAVVATGLAVAAGNAINDYFDREVDAVNQPNRPIPSGIVSPRSALVFSIGAFILAVSLALTLPDPAIIIAGVNLVALVLYTEYFKGLPGVGNAVVAYLGGSTFLFGAAAVQGLGASPAVLALLAGVATFSREIIKDVEDMAGDRAESLRTLPLVLGDRRALGVAASVVGLAVVASPVPYLMETFGPVYLIVVGLADCIMIGAVYRAFDDPSAGQSLLKVGMILGATAFVLGRVSMEMGWPT